MYNTGNPLGSIAPKDFSDNSEITDRYVNDVFNETTQDRFGRSRLTIHGQQEKARRSFEQFESDADALLLEKKNLADNVIATLGFFPPVDYTSGLTVDSQNFTVTYNGVVYAAQPSAVPFTTGAWDAAQWYPIQNLLNQKNLLIFGTYAEASAAAATLPDGQKVEVESEQKRYLVEGGALLFVENFLRSDLVGAEGSSLVGYDGGTVQDVLDSVKPMPDYAALRAYTGRASRVYITASGIVGYFRHDSSDATSVDNGGTVLKDALDRIWKREYTGPALSSWWGITNVTTNAAEQLQAAFVSVDSLAIVGTVRVTGDIQYKSGFTLHVPLGAELIVNGGRITPKTASINNVKIIIDGAISSVALPYGAVEDGGPSGKFDWTVISADGKHYAERAFIEFGGTNDSPSTGFELCGSGIVCGDWVGTPATHTWEIMPLKGIGSWRSDNVRVAEVEVYGFRAECVYHEEQARSASNIIFEDLRIHDVGHNGLNFNMAAIGINCHIRNNRIRNSFQAIEASSGNISGNTAYNSIAHGLQTGGAQGGSLEVVGNTFIDNGQEGIHVSFSEAWENILDGKVTIRGNTVSNCGSAGIRCFSAKHATIFGNSVDGFGTTYGIMCFSEKSTDIGTVFGNTIENKADSALGWIYTGGAGMRAYDNIVVRPSGETINLATYSGYRVPFSNIQNHSVLTVPYENFGCLNRYLVGADAVAYNGAIFAEVGALITSASETAALGAYVIRTKKSAATDLPANSLVIDSTGKILPGIDNVQLIGSASKRWGNIYLGANPIVSSDARLKQDIAELTATEHRVAIRLKGLIRTYRFRDAVSEKGTAARLHCGVIAQDVIAAFAAEGLDATRYALLCFDEWDASDAVLDDAGNVVRHAQDVGERLGVRYEELMAFVISAL